MLNQYLTDTYQYLTNTYIIIPYLTVPLTMLNPNGKHQFLGGIHKKPIYIGKGGRGDWKWGLVTN